MRSLRVKMTIAFVVTSLFGVVLVALLVQTTTVRAFETLVRSQQMDALGERLAVYYRETGSWEGVADYIRRTNAAALPGQGGAARDPGSSAAGGLHGQGGPQQGAMTQGYGLADMNGVVVLPVGQLRPGDTVPPDLLRRSSPLLVDGVEVGLLLNERLRPELTREEKLFRDQIGEAVLLAAGGVSVLAVLVSVLVAGAVTRPVREMTLAAEAITAGDLTQRVPVRTGDELGNLAVAFNRMSGQLDRSNRVREQMTADIAHDLRTPLTVLSGHLEGLSDGVLKPSRERFELLHHETQTLLRMVQDLRTLSLADAGQLVLYRTLTPLEDILERAASAHAPQAAAKAVSLVVECQDAIPSLNVDPQRMAQVMDNLVSNALRHSGEGGMITLTGGMSDGSALIRVSDTGEGIHPDNLPYVFERFYRSDSARFQRSSESGLGLAIVRGIVEAHEGTITVDSVYGEGTEFTVRLPLRG